MEPPAGENRHRLLADRIAAVLSGRTVLDQKTMDYIDSTHAAASMDSLLPILSDPENSEAETIYELLFFPTQTVQEQLEPILSQNAYDDPGVLAVIDLLIQKQLQTRICLPDQKKEVCLHIPDFAIRQFVYRLHITRKLHPTLSQTLARCVPDEKQINRIRVQIRNARISDSQEGIAFLRRFIEKTHSFPDLLEKALPLILDFLDQIKPEAEVDPEFLRTKQLYARMLEQASRIEQALKDHAVESLMLKGISIPAVNIQETKKKIEILDQVCALMAIPSDPKGPESPAR